jgi:NADH:ubiquinone oxidoreductase subunit 2 (subunit N)
MTGFISELFICRAGIGSGGLGMLFVFLMLANIVISLGYYLPSINIIMLSEGSGDTMKNLRPVPLLMQGAIVVTTLFVIILGIVPQAGLGFVSPAAAYLSRHFLPV